MEYVSVTSPGSEMSNAIFNYFDNYLISFGEVATSPGWSLTSLISNLDKILKEKPDNMTLYIDSGGFQIIMGYIYISRINDFIQSYHFSLKKLYKNIDRIFSLDVFNKGLSLDQIYNFNRESTQESIKLIKEIPEIADKQIYVLQTSNLESFKIWRTLLLEEEVYKYFKLWSIGGLVGLKKTTNAKFNHAVPATLWLLTYKQKFNFQINQMHWLGQSSRVSFIAMGLFERLYNINMTSDSSALVRFAPIEQKLPLMHKHNEEFEVIRKLEELPEMLNNHSFDKDDLNWYHHEYNKDFILPEKGNNKKGKALSKLDYPEMYPTRAEFAKEHYSDRGTLHDTDFVELQSQNIYFDIQFANLIADKIIEKGLNHFKTKDDVVELHPILGRGRIANETLNNIKYFRVFEDIVRSGAVDKADQIMVSVLKSYIKN